MRATMYDVAKRAGVSVATVSHVISGKRFVSRELQVKVQQAIAELNYIPNKTAQSLKYQQTSLIGLIVPDILNPFFAEIARAVQKVAFDNGFYVLLCDTAGCPKRERETFQVLIQQDTAGIIDVAPRIAVTELQEYAELTRVVVMDSPVAEDCAPLAAVFFDNYQGSAEMARFFLEQGHRSIACIMGPRETVPNVRFRVSGFVDTLKAAGIPEEDIIIEYGEFNFSSGYQLTEMLLAHSRRPTAIFAGNDSMAWGAMEACKAAQITVPDDMSIAGFDDVFFSTLLNPQLTTVAVPRTQGGKLGIELLLDLIAGQAEEISQQRLLLPCKLVVRDSVGRVGPPAGQQSRHPGSENGGS